MNPAEAGIVEDNARVAAAGLFPDVRDNGATQR